MSSGGRIQSLINNHSASGSLSIPSPGGSSVRLFGSPVTSDSIHSGKDNALSPKPVRAGFPSVRRTGPRRRRAFCPASLTVETALELPLFFLCVIVILHYSTVLRACAEFSGRMAQTAEQMALLAYSDAYGDSNHLVRGALSQAWAYSQVVPKTSDKDSVKNASFLFSSFLKENERISLVLTYQVKSPFSVIRVPYTSFVQKTVIRGWTGKNGRAGSRAGRSSSEEDTNVYVTETGSVYHTDPDCTHLKLTITKIPQSQLKRARNYKGGRYKRCRLCGNRHTEDGSVLINPYGDSHHTSASCSGLKRSVHTLHQDEVSGMRECMDCRKRRLS